MNFIDNENKSIGIVSKKQPNTNYSIDENGVAYVSQHEASLLTGIPQSTIQRWVVKNGSALNLNEFNQLSEDSLLKLLKMGRQKNIQQSIDLSEKMMTAGVRVFLYGMAKQEQPISIDSKIEQLKSDNEDLKNRLLSLENPEKINTHLKHEQLMEWVSNGWLFHNIKNIIKHEYELTDTGKQYLYSNKNKIESIYE